MSVTPNEEIASAEALYTALEERIKAGDESVTPDELDRARGLSRFARLRAEAAERRRAQERRETAAAAVESAAADAEEFLSTMADLDDELTAARDAFTTLCAAVDAQREEGIRVMTRLQAANAAAEQLGVPDSFDESRPARIRATHNNGHMVCDGERFTWSASDHSAFDIVRSTISSTDIVVDGARSRSRI